MSGTQRRTRALSALVIGTLSLVACSGAGDEGSRNGPVDPTTTLGPAPGGGSVPTTAAGTSPLPDLDVRDVATGENRPLRTLLPAATPLLVWFWAPH